MNIKLFFPVIMAFAAIGAGCTSSANITATNENTAANPNPTTTQAVAIKNFAFSPATLTIKTGTTVIWTNADSAAHDVTGNDLTSLTLNQGDTFEYTFDKAGTYDYICGLHPAMQGTIVVE